MFVFILLELKHTTQVLPSRVAGLHATLDQILAREEAKKWAAPT